MERQELEKLVDDLYERVDEQSFEIMNRILDDVRGETNIAHIPIQRSLGQSALRELGTTKKPKI